MTGVEVIVPVAFFITVIWIIKIVSDNRTRSRLIEKGMVDEKLKFLYTSRWSFDTPSSLKWGMVFVGIGAAVIIGRLVPSHYRDEITIASIFVLAGLALILYYLIAPRVEKRDRNNGQ